MSKMKEQMEKLLQLMHSALQSDQELRKEYRIGDKFRFIRDRLTALVAHVETNLAELQKEKEKKQDTLAEDERLVYVHLFNVHGLSVSTWNKMVHPSVFYDHSVNRPIYSEKSHIEAFIRGKINKMQHAYLTIAIKKSDIATAVDSTKDPFGHPILKVREGSLKPSRVFLFTHNDQEYEVNEESVLVKKTD